jgi:hypothetical protein
MVAQSDNGNGNGNGNETKALSALDLRILF